MSLLDGTYAFRASQFESFNGVNAVFTLNEDSIHQYSRAQIQRRNEALQRIDQKQRKDDNIDDKEKIDTTISEDLADGQNVKLDASLNLLCDDHLVLIVPSDEPDDDEIHIIETTLGAPQGGEHRLQDFQMQLMLLEQQNKKRLLLARQEQDAIREDNTIRQEQAPTLRARMVHERRVANKEQVQVLATEKRALIAPSMPKKGRDKGTVPTTRKRKREDRPRDQSSDLDKSDDVVNDKSSVMDQGGLFERMPPHFDILYKISCVHSETGTHPVPAFRDAPVSDAPWDPEALTPARPHLNGTVPIFDLEAFMTDDTDDIAFVIIRTVECSEASILMARAGVPLRWTEDIYTKSKISKNVMQQIATCYFQPTTNPNEEGFEFPPRMSRVAPFEQNRITPVDLFLFHHRDLLKSHILQHPTSKQHIDALLEYMEHRYGKEFMEADDLFARGLVNKAHILKLFRPNKLVVSGTYGRPAAFVVQEWPKLDHDDWVTLTCWSFQTDGSGFARKESILSIPPIEPETTCIQKLPAYPLEYAAPEIREQIRVHGEKQWELRTTTQITYKGWNVKGDQYFPDARFMIDHKVYRKMHEHALAFKFDKPTTTHPFDQMPAYLDITQTPSDISILLMQPALHGFYLNEKKWVQLFVDCVHPVSWNKKAYERLVLPPQTKDLIRALVTVRTSQKGIKQGIGAAGKRTDITGGKGNGLIMLLHGGPGTGKTLTAESVAEIAEMPLYRVTCGDIGTNAEAVEKYLNTVLHLGKIWNCVLLLDEADVFLEERSTNDLKRNSLVSVFLRILEYYDGILILTSNRVGMFDEAFKSRIQVALHYDNLNRSSRKKIWQNFMDMLEEDEENVNFDEIKLHLDDLAGNEFNGRQIRNVLTTARQLAIFRNERLDWEHLTQALLVSSNFNAYLKSMQGHTDDQRARDIGLR